MTSGIFYVLTTFVILCCNFSPGFVLVSDPLWSRPLLGWEFSGCPVTKTWCFYCWGPGSIPCWATKIPQAEWCNQKKKKKKTPTWLAYRYFTLIVSWAEPMFSTEPAPPPGSLNSGNECMVIHPVLSEILTHLGPQQPIRHWASLSLFRWMSWIYSPSSLLTPLQSILHSSSPFSLFPQASLCSRHCGDSQMCTSDHFSSLVKVFSALRINKF